MACPALPMCGLATTEAERALPDINVRIRAALVRAGLSADEHLLVRMTGCPNGCARPYMAEMGFVGDGPNSYQVCVLACFDNFSPCLPPKCVNHPLSRSSCS